MKKLVLLVSCAALAACGSEQSGTFQTEDGETGTYTVDQSDGEGSISVKTDDGEFTMQSGADVDAELPEGFSLYPGATVLSNSKISHSEGSNVSVMMSTDATAEEVLAFYRPQIYAAGIEVKTEFKNQGSTMIGGDDGAGNTIVLNVSPGNDGMTAVNLALSKANGE